MPSGPKKRRAARRKKEMEEQMKAPSASDPPRDDGRSEDQEAEGQSPTFCSAPILSSKEGFRSDADDSAAESSKNLKDEDLVEEDERESAPAVKEVAFRLEDESAAKSDIAESEEEKSKPADESTISVDNAERNQVMEFAARVLEEASGDNTEKETQLPGADEVVNHNGDGHQVAGLDETSSATKEAAAEVLEGISDVAGEKESQLPDVDASVKHGADGRRAAVGDEALPATEVLESDSCDCTLLVLLHPNQCTDQRISHATQLLHRSPPVERRTKWWNCCGLLDFATNLDG